jgi:DNA-binding transcriptional regulator LsrR (DeoR family)
MLADLQTEADMYALVMAEIATDGTQREFARRLGISEQFVGDVVKKRKAVGETIARHFGYRPVRRYERIQA